MSTMSSAREAQKDLQAVNQRIAQMVASVHGVIPKSLIDRRDALERSLGISQEEEEKEPGAKHLIAAAPDLLDACRAIAALADGQGRANMLEIAGQARAAIAKAEGRA